MPVTSVRALRAQRGRGQPREVALSDRLTVRVRLTDVDTLIAVGKIPNPLVPAALELKKRDAAEPLTAADVTARMEMFDSLAAAIVVEPEWAGLDEVSATDDLAPEGKLCIADLYPGEVSALWTLCYLGVEVWDSFRAQRARDLAAADGDADGAAPVSVADAANAPGSSVADAAGGPDGGSGTVSASYPSGGQPDVLGIRHFGPATGAGVLSDADWDDSDAGGAGLRPERSIIQLPVLGYVPEAVEAGA